MRTLSQTCFLLFLMVGVASCSDGPDDVGSEANDPEAATDVLTERIDELQASVTAWSDATTIEDAHAAAEEAANLVVGPNGPAFGDRDRDGTVEGMVTEGLLPGLDGSPAGIASQVDPSACITRDVLGATAADPETGWNEMRAAIDEWTPSNNTMPSLDSHPMRIVGWATFTLASSSLDEAHEYAGHAQLHVDVTRAALNC